MTIEDANYLLGLAEANYEYYFKTKTDQQKIMLVHSWAFGLQDIPADIVMMAFLQEMTVCKYLPSVAEIREAVKELRAEAKDEVLKRADYRRMCQMLGEKCPEIQPTREDHIREYIIESTNHMDGQKSPKLRLNTILHGTSVPAIGSGRMGFLGDDQDGQSYPMLEGCGYD